MPEGPFGGPRPFADVDNELMIRLDRSIDDEDKPKVREDIKSIVNALDKLEEPVSFVGGPNNDVILSRWVASRVTETDLKSIRQTMNGRRGIDSSIAQVEMLSVTLDN